jgi:uncharacterized membrane protein
MFYGITGSKTVTVGVPGFATGYDEAWQSGFTGENLYINLEVEYTGPNIILDQTDPYAFPAANVDYGTQEGKKKSVKISNTGNQPTGALTLALSDSAAFTLSATSVNSIAAGDTASFTVFPTTGLVAGDHSAVVTVSGASVAERSFSVSFRVNSYGISLNPQTHTFPPAIAGYGTQTEKSVTISNTGNQPTGALTVALDSYSHFEIAPASGSYASSSINIDSISTSGSFKVRPKTELSASTTPYTATVTVSGDTNITAKSFTVSFTVDQAPTYGINLDATGTHTFLAATAGYGTQTEKSVAITNTGNQPTGDLTVALNSYSHFEIAPASGSYASSSINIDSISTSDSFKVRPKTGLAAGTYSATVTVSGGTNITAKNYTVSFTVNAPTYGINLDTTGTHTFLAATAGYGTQPEKTVNISNSGNQPTGALTVALNSYSHFEIASASGSYASSSIDIGSISTSGSFKVRPKTGLAANTYTATVTVSGGTNITAKNFTVSFTVNNPAPTYGISLNQTGTYIFSPAATGYGAQEAKSVTISNTGNQPTGALTVALNSYSHFEIAPASGSYASSSINIGSISTSDSFNVRPKTGLAANTYTATVTVSGGTNITSKNFCVSFTVENDTLGFSSVAAASDYLSSQSGGSTASNPVTLKLNVNLASSTDGWYALVTALASRNKYVALDLSGSSVSNGEFDSGMNGADSVGTKIVSLILPDSATSIVGGSTSLAVYANLKTVSGANITTIGDRAFYNRASLTSASFPNATSIGNYAFYYSSLTTASFPNATNIGEWAFYRCLSLTTVSFPEATSIGYVAFAYCTALTTVSFPKVKTIINGNILSSAFSGCTSLTTASFPEATSIGGNAFNGCSALTTVSIPKVTSIGYNAFESSGRGALVITMGAAAPTVGNNMFNDINGSRTVTVRVPSGATGYTDTWKTAFKGGNSYIDVVIQYY